MLCSKEQGAQGAQRCDCQAAARVCSPFKAGLLPSFTTGAIGSACAGRGKPEEKVWFALTAQFLLPFHLVVKEGRLVEEITDFAALLVLLRGGEEPVLCLFGEELADARHREDYLLHASVQTHNLQEAG